MYDLMTKDEIAELCICIDDNNLCGNELIEHVTQYQRECAAEKQPKNNGWIPIETVLPPKDRDDLNTSVVVDVFAKGERWPECYYCFFNEEWIDANLGEDVFINSDVTHWKPITKPQGN